MEYKNETAKASIATKASKVINGYMLDEYMQDLYETRKRESYNIRVSGDNKITYNDLYVLYLNHGGENKEGIAPFWTKESAIDVMNDVDYSPEKGESLSVIHEWTEETNAHKQEYFDIVAVREEAF